MVALGRFQEYGVRSIGNAESKDFVDCAVLIGYFHAPWSLIRLPELDDAVCGPLGRINAQSDLRAQLIPMKPAVVYHGSLGNGIEGGEAANLPRRDWERHALDRRAQILNFLTDGGLDQIWPLSLLLWSRGLPKASAVIFRSRIAPQNRNQGGHSYEQDEEEWVQSFARMWGT